MVVDYVGNCLRRYAFLNHLRENGLKEIMEKNWDIAAEIRSSDGKNQDWHNETWSRVLRLVAIRHQFEMSDGTGTQHMLHLAAEILLQENTLL